jgi:hypothetical protein
MTEQSHAKSSRKASNGESLPVRLEHDLETAKETLSKLDSGIRRFAAREPMMAALGALGVGFLLGKLLSR